MRRLVRRGVLSLVVSAGLVAVIGAPASARRPTVPHTRHPRRPPKPPPAPADTVEIGDQAPLSADHQTADVLLTVTCRDVTPAPIRVTVRQNHVGGTGSGTGYKCTGQPQRVVVPVHAGSDTFQTGSAQASAAVMWHGSSGAGSTTQTSSNNTRTVQLT